MSFRRTEGIPPFAFRETLKETAGTFAQPRQMPAQRRCIDLQDAQHIVRVARQLLEAITGKLASEIIAGHILDFMGLIEDHGGIFRQDRTEILLANREVGEKKMVIDDN